MKKKGIKKKAGIIFMIFCMIFTMAAPAFAAENVTLSLRPLSSYYKVHHNVIDWGAYDGGTTVFMVNGEYAFCTESGNAIRDANGNQWAGGNATINASYNMNIVTQDNSEQSKIAYLGFYQYEDDPEIWNDQVTRDWYYAMTQMFIWQSLPARSITSNGMTNGQYNSYFLNSSLASEYAAFKQRVQAKVDTWNTRSSFNGQMNDIKAGETITLTDTNGVFEDYNSFTYSKNGVTVTHNKGSNILNVRADKNCAERTVMMLENNLIAAGGEKYSTKAKVNYAYTSGNSQDMTVYGYTDPVPLILAFNVDIVTGRIAIEKTKSPDAASHETLPEEGEKFSKYSRPKPSINQQREPSGRTAERLSHSGFHAYRG